MFPEHRKSFDVILSLIGQTRGIKIWAEFNLGTGQKVNTGNV